MKTRLAFLLPVWLGVLVQGCSTPPPPPGTSMDGGKAAGGSAPVTWSSVDSPDKAKGAQLLPPGGLALQKADFATVQGVYERLSARSLFRMDSMPNVSVTVSNAVPWTRLEALQALDTALAKQGIIVMPMGSKWLKAVPVAKAPAEAPPIVELPWQQLPDSDTYISIFVRVEEPSRILPALQPLAALPNSIIAIDGAHLLVLRDYSANIRRMMRVVETIVGPAMPTPKAL